MLPQLGGAEALRCQATKGEDLILFEREKERSSWVIRQSPPHWERAPLDAIELYCHHEQCRDPEAREAILSAINLPLYQPLTQESLLAGWRRFMQTGLFEATSHVILQKDSDSGRLTLKFCGESAPIIRSITVEYTSWSSVLYPRQFLSELDKRLTLKRGGPLPLSPAAIERQERQLERSYERQGYQGVKVKIAPIFFDQQRRYADVKILILEGSRPTLSTPLIELLDHPEDDQQKQGIIARTVRMITPELFFDILPEVFGLFGVGRYDKKVTRQRAEELERQLREEGWSSARVKVIKESRSSGRVSPIIQVRYGLKLEPVFIGNHSLSETVLSQELTFQTSGVIDEVELEASRQKLINRYKSASFYYVRINAQLKETNAGAIEARFMIDEGPKVYIGKLIARGVSPKLKDEIERVMFSKGVAPEGVLHTFGSTSGILQDTTLSQDLARVLERYEGLGYTSATLRCSSQIPQSSSMEVQINDQRSYDLWTKDVAQRRCFRVIPDQVDREKRRLLTVIFEVNEGQKTALNFVDFSPFNQSMNEQVIDDLNQLLQQLGFLDDLGMPVTRAGLSKLKLDLMSNFLLLHLKQQGYLQARVTPLCQLKKSKISLTQAKPCNLKELYGETIERLSFQAQLGPRAEVAGLIIKGQLLSQPEILKRELLLQRGGPLSAEALLLSQNNLRGLGLFKSVNLTPIGLGTAPVDALREPVTLVLNVEENLPWQMDGFFGLRLSDQSLGGETTTFKLLYTSALSLRHRNVFGRGWELGGGLSHDNLLITPLDIEGDYASWAVGPFFKNPRFFNSHVQLTSELVYEQNLSRQRTAYVQGLRGSATLSYQFYHLSFPRRWGRALRFDLTFEGQLARQRPLSLLSERRAYGDVSPTFKVRPALVYDQRDNPIHPTRGAFLTTSVDFLGGDSLSKGVISYRESLSAQWVYSLLKRRIILVPSLKLGAIQSSLDDQTLAESITDFLFTAGGDGVSYPVRGYPVGVINVCSSPQTTRALCEVGRERAASELNLTQFAGRGLVNFSFETRVPSFIIGSLWWATFFDLGAVSPDLSSWATELFFPSMGLGLRYLLPGQVPIRFDVAYPLRETLFSRQVFSYHFNFFYTL